MKSWPEKPPKRFATGFDIVDGRIIELEVHPPQTTSS
jgi:hypothetical protein